jgi:hypothetical protein
VTTLKTAWRNLRKKAKVSGRWHDNRHTLVTELAESGASDQTIMDIAGHVSKQMLKHYSHIRMEAKRAALESIVQKQPLTPVKSDQKRSPAHTFTQQIERQYPQKFPQSADSSQVCSRKKDRKSLKRFGSSGRTRTYNPSVNSRIFARSCVMARKARQHFQRRTLVGLTWDRNASEESSYKKSDGLILRFLRGSRDIAALFRKLAAVALPARPAWGH